MVAFVMLCVGFDKMLSYSNEKYAYRNAYVGGDAYNYIINGNYATAFFVLAALFSVIGIGILIVNHLSSIDKKLAGSKVGAESSPDKLPKEAMQTICVKGNIVPLEDVLPDKSE